MIACYYTETTHPWSEQELTDRLVLLPPKLRQEALRKRGWLDRQLSVLGKLLLIKLLKELGLQKKLSLTDLQYNIFHRPYFNATFDFNIAHSGNMVTCCGSLNGKVGMDIELIKKIDLDDYTDHFTENEWNHINRSSDRQERFYHYWTRKEAALKAIGTGFHTPLASVDVAGESLVYDDHEYHFQTLNIDESYKCHIASTSGPLNIRAIRVNL
jgi:4'-phosphopantetheinyl transferase